MSFRVAHGPASHSTVLHERGWRRYGAHSPAGALSIKCMFGGAAHYETRLGRYRVDDGHFLILNHGTAYSVAIDSPQPMESFCVFFAPGFVEEAFRVRTTQQEKLLSNPAEGSAACSGFFERTYPQDGGFARTLRQLRHVSLTGRCAPAWWDEALHGLASRMLALHREAQREAARIPAVRPATRVELYRRLHRARDYMEACIGEPLRLQEIARVAAMAPHHFLRAFKQAFGSTPHQYLTARRIERARQMLAGTQMTVTEVGLETSFSSLGSFSWLFRQRTGLSPAQFRCLRQAGAK